MQSARAASPGIRGAKNGRCFPACFAGPFVSLAPMRMAVARRFGLAAG